MKIELKDSGYIVIVHVKEDGTRTEKRVDYLAFWNRICAAITNAYEAGESNIEACNTAIINTIAAEGFDGFSRAWADSLYFELKKLVDASKKKGSSSPTAADAERSAFDSPVLNL